MKKYVVIFLLLILSNAVFKDLVSYTYFVSNQDYIIENYCVNIAKPEKLCSGKCYLDTMIEKNHSNDSYTFSVDDHNILRFVMIPSLEIIHLQATSSRKEIKQNFPRQKDFLNSYMVDVFHPPALFV